MLLRGALALQVCRGDVVLGPESPHCLVSMHASNAIDQRAHSCCYLMRGHQALMGLAGLLV